MSVFVGVGVDVDGFGNDGVCCFVVVEVLVWLLLVGVVVVVDVVGWMCGFVCDVVGGGGVVFVVVL